MRKTCVQLSLRRGKTYGITLWSAEQFMCTTNHTLKNIGISTHFHTLHTQIVRHFSLFSSYVSTSVTYMFSTVSTAPTITNTKGYKGI